MRPDLLLTVANIVKSSKHFIKKWGHILHTDLATHYSDNSLHCCMILLFLGKGSLLIRCKTSLNRI